MSKTLTALKCCREKQCEECPLMLEICDELRVEMVNVPEELLDKIEDELAEK